MLAIMFTLLLSMLVNRPDKAEFVVILTGDESIILASC